MKFQMMSVVVGTSACVTVCPFCVSGEFLNKENRIEPKVNWRNFKIACKLADRSGVDTVMLTSRGEPTLFPNQITEYLEHLQEFGMPFKELQTNGIPMAKNMKKYRPLLEKWYELGLTHITISTVSNLEAINKEVYTPHAKQYIDLSKFISELHEIGLSVRLTCVCTKEWMSTSKQVKDYIEFAKSNKVEQVTLRPLNDEYRRETAQVWIDNHKMLDEDKENIRNYLNENGTVLMELNRIGTVYDVNGQNVMFSVPLTKYTNNSDSNEARNLIFFQDGHIRYEWEKEGGILL